MKETLDFYDLKSKTKFSSSDWRIEPKDSRDGRVRYFAVAKVPAAEHESWRVVSTDFALSRLLEEPKFSSGFNYAALVGVMPSSLIDLIGKIEEGLPYGAFEKLARLFDVSATEMADWLRIPQRTLQRRKASGELTIEESERVLRLSRIAHASFELFEGDQPAAINWLRRANRGLGGTSPLEMSSTEIGGEEVLNLIGRLEYGVFS
jgi:putative toxin-antitoxin system antitoxin component (TIGR02293 family)